MKSDGQNGKEDQHCDTLKQMRKGEERKVICRKGEEQEVHREGKMRGKPVSMQHMKPRRAMTTTKLNT